MAGLGTGAPIVRVYHEKSMILPDVSRVLACLYEKEIEVDRRPSSSYKSLLRLQASSHVPVPFDDGLTFLEDSREICRYIAETYEHHGYPFLLGKDSLERASIEQWLHHEEHAFNPPSRSLFCHLAFPLAEEDDDIELQKRKLEEVLEVYEQRLGDSEFLAGNKFTLADLVHLPNSQYITDSDKFVYLYDSRKNVQRWWNTISTRKSWQNVLKDIQVVEQQRKQEEFEKQQQRQREHPPTTRRRFRLDPRKQPSTKSQTILVPPPVGIIATSPTASQAEKPLPTKTSPDETLLSTSTTHKPSAVQSKHTTTFTAQRETPPAPVQSTPRLPGYSHIPVQSTSNHFIPATSPTTAENPSRTGADKPGIRGVSLPSESTEIDLTANSKRSSSNEVSQNLRVFHFYEASSHTDEAEPYTEPTPQKPSEMLDRISGTDGPSNATDHVKTSPISAKEDSGSSGFWTDNTATNADTPDKKSVRYTERTPQKPVETIYSRSTDHSATYTSPGKHGSPETHQNLQTEQWHGTVAGLSNLKGETDHSMPTQQVKPGKDVHHSSSQDSEQVSSHPLAQEPVSMDRRLVQGPEMTPQTLYTDQKRDVSSMLWQKTADVRGIAEEDKSSSDHSDAVLPPYARRHVEEEKIVSADHRKDASLPKRVKDEDTQAIPFQTAYDDAHDIAQEARETASAPRRRTQDAYDTSEVRETYHSSSSRPQPIHLPQNAAPPSKQAASEGTRRATAPYPAAQEFIKQARESPASRSTVPHDTQGSTEAETGESSSSKAHLSDSRLADALPPKKFLDGDEYGAIAPLQTGYADDPYNRKRDRDTAAPKRMMSQGAFEEMEMNDSASSEAQAFDHQQADAPQKQRLAEGPQTTASPLKKRYSGGEDATSRPRGTVAQEVQDNFKETKAGDSLSIRKPPSDTRRAPPLLPRRQVEDDHSTTAATQKRYPGTGGTVKEVEESTSMPRRVAGGDAKEMLEETKFAGSASSRAQPLYYDGTDAPSRKQDAIEDPLGATSPLERRYADSEDTTKHSRDTAFKPSKMVGQDAEDTSEEAVRNSTLFRAQPQDARRVATTPSKQAAEDVLSVSPSSPKRYPRAEETSKQPRAAASKPTPIAAQDARDVFRESKVADSTSSIEQPSDTRVAASFQKQEVPDARNTRASFQERYPDVKGATKKSKVTFEDTKSPDSATSRVRPSDSQRDYAPSWKKEATEAPRATSPIKQRHSDVEDTAKHSMDNVSKPTKMVGQDTQGTYEETKASERASDTWQAATTPTEKVATKDGPGETPPSESNAPSDEDTNMRPRGTASAPRRATVEDDRDTFQGSKPADSVLSREQPLSARQPAVTPSRQETEDSYSKISAFHKTRPFVEDSTRQGVDTVVGPRQNGAKDAKDITEETKVADSASSVRERPTYTLQTAHPLSEQAEVEEDARDKDREGTETTSAPKKMVSRDGEHTYGERKIPHSASREQSLDMQASSPLKQAAAEDPRGATKGETSQPVSAQDVKGTSKKSVGTVEETKGHVTFPTSQPVSAQDAQRTDRSSRTPTADQRKDAPTQPQSNLEDTYKEAKPSYGYQKVLGSPPSQAEAGDDAQAIMGEKVFSEQLRKMPKESRLASSKAQPADSRSPTKEERTPSVYQEDHLVPPDSRQQPQTLPTGVRADSSTPKRQQAPVVPSTSEEKSTPSTSPRAKAHDDHTTEEPFRRDTVDDPKGAPLLSSREPTSQVQRATELTPDGDMSSKPSSIDQWRLASAPIQGLTPNSGDDVPGVSTIDQKPTPMIQQSIPSARGANEMVKGEQRMVTSAPAGAQTPDAQHVRPSLQEPDMAERDGESVKMQVPTLQARPTSVPTRRATSDARDVGDNEFANTSDAQRWKALKAKHDSAMIDEDVRDASLSTDDATGDKTTWHASEAQVLDTLPGSTATPVNVRPTSGDELVKRFERDQGAKPPESAQAQTPSDDPRDSVSTQGLPSDALDKARFVKPSSTEGMRPTAGPDSALEAQLAEHKFAPSDTKSARAAQPLSSVESRKEDTSVSAADQTKKPQTIFHQEARPSTPITKQVPSSNSFHDTRKIQQATLDNLPTDYSSPPHVPSYEQVSHTPQTIPSERDMTPVPGTSDSPASNTKVASAEVQEAIPANYHPDELTVPFVPSEKQGSYAGSSTEPHEGPYHDAPSAAHDKGISKYPSRQAPVVGSRPDSTPADSYVRPTSGDEPGILPDQGAESPTAAQETNSEDRRNEVFPTEKKFAPSAQGSVNSVQKRSPAETWKGEAIVAAAEQTEPINIGQQHTQDMRKARTSQFVPAEDIPSDARSGKPDEVALAEQKFASSGNHAPDDHQKVESLRSQGQVSRAKPPFVPSEGPIHDSHSDIDKKTTKVPSSQAQSSDPKPDPTQSHSYEPPTRLFPSQLPNQHEETQALPPLVGPYDSKPSQDLTSDTLGEAKSLKPSSLDQEAMGSALTPDTHLGSAPGEVAPSEQKLLLKDQDSAHPTQKSSSSEPTKEQSTVTAPNEAKMPPTIFSQQDVALAQPKMKDPSSGSQYAPQKLQEITPEDQRITGSIPRQHQVPLDKNTTPPSSQAQSSDLKRDSLPKSVDVNSSSGQQSTTRILRGQGVQLPGLTRSPPLHESLLYPESNEDVPKSSKPPSPNKEVTSAKVVPAPAPDTLLGTSADEIAPDGQNFPLPAQDLARSAQRPSSVEPTKEKGIVASSDQTNEALTIIGQRRVAPSADKEKTPFDLQASELAKPPNENQEQFHAGSAYEQREGPTPDARAAVDENMPLPSSQAQNSEIRPDSASISGVAHRTSGDQPTTRSLRDPQAQPPAGTQNVPTVFLEKIEPGPPSADQELIKPKTSPAPAPEAPQDQDLTTSQLSPSVVSRKDVDDQTNVSQAGLSEPASSDSTRPSENIQEFSPDAYLTKSEKSLLPVKGADPVQTPYEASLDLSSDEKTTMIKGDQTNTISSVSLSASQAVGQPEYSAVKGPPSEEPVSSFSQKNLQRTPPEETSKQQQQIDQSNTRSSKDDSIEARGTANPNILTRPGDIQQSPVKESMQVAQGSRNQQQADQAVFQSTQENEMQIEETEAQDNGSEGAEKIRPDSAPISGTSNDGKATVFLRDSQSQPPVGTLNVPAVLLESPRRPTTVQELVTPVTTPALAPDTPQEDSTQSPQLSPSVLSSKIVADADQTDVSQAGLRVPGSSDAALPSEEKQEFSPEASLMKSAKALLPMTGTDPVQPPDAVGQSENSAVKRPPSEESVSLFSQKILEKTLPEEKSKQQQQTDQSGTRSSSDDSIEASGTANPNIKTTGDLQPSPVKERIHATEGSRDQVQADQAVFQSTQGNRNQIQENEAQDNGSDGPEEIRSDSAPISGDAHRTGVDGPAISSLRDSQEQPPAGTLNVPTVFLEKIESPRPPSTDQELMTSKTSPAPAPGAPQDQDSTRSPQLSPSVVSRKDVANADRTNVSQAGLREPATSNVTRPEAYLTKSEKPLLPTEGSNPVQTPNEASFDLSSNKKPTMIKGEQANTTSNVSLSASQPVGQSETSAVKGPLSEDLVSSFSEKNLERTLSEEKPKLQQKTDRSSGTASPNILTTSGGIQPSSPLKESMQAAQGSRNQQQAGQAVFESMQDNVKKIEETEAQDNGSDKPKEIRPDSAPISGDVRRTRDSLAEPPAGTLNVPAVFLENIESPRPMTPMNSPAPAPDTPQGTAPREAATAKDSTQSPQLSPSVVSRKDVANADQTNVPQAGLREPASSGATRPSEEIQELSADASLTKSAKPLLPMTGTNPVQPPHEASFDLSSDGKPGMIKGDQANTISNVSLSASQAVGQSENSAVTEPLSEDLVSPLSQKNLEGTSPAEKPNQQQQTDQSNTRSSKDESIVASGTTNPYISTSGDIQPSALKESAQAAEGSRDQQPADQDVFQSTLDTENQFVETEARDVGPDELAETNLQQSTNQKNNGPSQRDALEQSAELIPAVQSRSNDTNIDSKQTMEPPASIQEDNKSETSLRSSEESKQQVWMVGKKEAPASSQEDNKSETSLRSSEESKQQVRTVGKTQGGESKAPASKTEQPEERDLRPLSNKGIASQSQQERDLAASQPVGQSENSAVKGPLSEDLVSSFSKKNLERTLPEEKPKQQQQTDQSSTTSAKDNSIEASRTASPNILTTSGGIQPSALKEGMQAAQQQAGQAVFESMQDNVKKIEEMEAQDNGSNNPKEIRPDSAPIGGDARRTSDDGPASDSWAEPPAGTLTVPAVFLENIKSPRPMTPMTSLARAPDAPQDQDSTKSPQLSPSVVSKKDVANADQTNVPQEGLREPASLDATRPSEKIQELSADASLTKSAKPLLPMTGTNPVQPPHEASFDLSSDGKPGMIKGDQANTISNVSLSASQAVGQSENSAVTEPLSEYLVSPLSQKSLEGTSPEEKPNQQQQTDQSNTRSSKDESIEASGTTNPYISTSRDIQPSALKERIQAAEGSRNQQQADQAVFESAPDNENQFVETEARHVGPDKLAETNLQQSTNQKNNGGSQRGAFKQPEDVPAKDAPGSIQENEKSESSLRTSEESKQQPQTNVKTQAGETKAPAAEIKQPEGRDVASSNKVITNQSGAETSYRLEEQTSPGIKSSDTDSSNLEGSTDDMKSADTDNNPQSP